MTLKKLFIEIEMWRIMSNGYTHTYNDHAPITAQNKNGDLLINRHLSSNVGMSTLSSNRIAADIDAILKIQIRG